MTHADVAHAAPFELDWSAPEGCPSREQIITAARNRLGESGSRAPPEFFVRGTVAMEDSVIVVDFQIKDAAGTDIGERRVRFEGPSCESIEEPTAIVLAMMIGVAGPRAAAHPPADEQEAKLAASPVPAPPRSHLAIRRAVDRPRMTLSASALASLGLLPNTAIGGALRWTVLLSNRMVLGVEGTFETSSAVRAASGEAMFRFFDVGGLFGLRVVSTRWLEVVPLIEARGGLMAASTTGFPSPYDSLSFVGILSAGALARVIAGPGLRIEVLPDVGVPLVRDEFRVREGGELFRVHRPAPIDARLSLGVGWEFH